MNKNNIMNMNNRNVHFTTAHLPKKYTWKKWLIGILIIAILSAFIFFPEQVGDIIGDWVEKFRKGYFLD